MFINREINFNKIDSGNITVVSPSNIALVKYWGKFGVQLPCNPSLSITLKNAHTKTSVSFSQKSNDEKIDLNFYFEGNKNEKFGDKVKAFLESIIVYCPYLTSYTLKIDSMNTFPHSSGIASSASSMSSIAKCIVELERKLTPQSDLDEDYLTNKASFLARIGSGSACRSLFDQMSIWGEAEFVTHSSNEVGISFNDFHPMFNEIKDSIAIVSAGEKAVSSRAGHALMKTHPFAAIRFENARVNLNNLLKALHTGDFNSFSEIVESEALELHGLMMNSKPSFILMAPNTLKIILLIREYRQATNAPICFTLDAGPNVHILYLDSHKKQIREFLEAQILPLCEGRPLLHDEMGQGAHVVIS